MMNPANAQSSTTRSDENVSATGTDLLTIFTIVKPFVGQADLHQRNAINSWNALGRDVRIILFCDVDPPADIENNFECHSVEKLNANGTPLLDDVFARMSMLANSPYLGFVNADIIFDNNLVEAIHDLDRWSGDQFLAIGRRMDTDIDQQLEPKNGSWVKSYLEQPNIKSKKASIVCKDYFVFSKGLFENVPSFAVGRGNWDNWMVHHAKTNQIPVVDLSEQVIALHQNHDYRHVDGGRLAAYVNGREARENERLAEGRNLVRGSVANWKLSGSKVIKDGAGNWRFWIDSLNFLRLMRNLLFLRQ